MKKWLPVVAGVNLALGVCGSPEVLLRAHEPDHRTVLEAFQKQLQTVAKSVGPSIVLIVVSRSEFYPLQPPETPPGRLGAFDPHEFIKGDSSPSRVRLAKYLDLSDPQAVAEHSRGNGVVLDASGLILTLYHVIEGARKIYVHTSQGGSYADIHAADARSDLAVLKLIQPPDGLVPVRFADVLLYDLPQRQATVAPGRLVVLLAHAGRGEFRLDKPSASFGSLTNVRHRLGLLRGDADVPMEKQASYYRSGVLLEHDVRPFADISGAALVNLDGELLGLVTAGAVVYDRPIGPGYALPADENFLRIVQVLRRGEEVEYGFLGVTLADNRGRRERGVEIASVNPGGPADQAGLRPGDLIIRINGYPITSYDDLLVHIGGALAGSKVELTVLPRLGPPRTVMATLTKFYNPQPYIASVRPTPVFGLRVDYSSVLSLRLRSQPLALAAPILPGVCIREVVAGSPMEKKLKSLGEPLDRWLITHVNRQAVTTPAAFYAACKDQKSLTFTLIDVTETPPRPRELTVP